MNTRKTVRGRDLVSAVESAAKASAIANECLSDLQSGLATVRLSEVIVHCQRAIDIAQTIRSGLYAVGASRSGR